MSTHHPITVVGGGLGGLTLAAVLHRHGIATAVYDLDTSPSARDQGGMLDMHEESGQAALRAAGLFDRFQDLVAPSGEAMRILDRDGTLRYSDDGDDGNRPEIGRSDLRDLLLSALPADTVRWGAKVTDATALCDGRHRITTADGTTFTTDLLIGADGAWSKVRPLVSAATPVYSGLSFVEASLFEADTRHPDSAELVGTGSLFALAEDKGFLAHRNGDGRLHIYVALKVPENCLAGIDFTDTATAKARLLTYFDGWHARLLALITDADGELVPRSIHALPIGHRWARTAGVTLLGDAAHLMSPFAGEGANLAMLDATELATAIAAGRDDVERALADYERTMFPRAEAAATESAANVTVCFGPGAPQGLIDQMISYQTT